MEIGGEYRCTDRCGGERSERWRKVENTGVQTGVEVRGVRGGERWRIQVYRQV